MIVCEPIHIEPTVLFPNGIVYPVGYVFQENWIRCAGYESFCLPCDGSMYRHRQYPALYDVVAQKDPPLVLENGFFRVPDLRGIE
jgi:hypothetical protein